jgi:hypothetical protein
MAWGGHFMTFSKVCANQKEVSIPTHTASDVRYIFGISARESSGADFKWVKYSPST